MIVWAALRSRGRGTAVAVQAIPVSRCSALCNSAVLVIIAIIVVTVLVIVIVIVIVILVIHM